MLVTGGRISSDSYQLTASTELLVDNALAWVFTGELPSARMGIRGANIEYKLLIAGNNNYNNI